MKNIKKIEKPRILVNFNTGTKILKSKKDKAKSRQRLKLELKQMF